MHRSRLSVLVIFAAVAACSTNDDTKGTDLLSQDRTLSARLEIDQETKHQPLPAACSAVSVASQPDAANQQQSRELTLQAQVAEMKGDEREASALLRRASDLDATNQSAAYHLGRVSEALGDRAAAVTAYCRYLALSPTSAESAEARQRVAALGQSQSRAATEQVAERTPAHRTVPATPVRHVASERPRFVSPAVASATSTRSTSAPRRAERTTGMASGEVAYPVTPTGGAAGTSEATVAGPGNEGAVVATSQPEPAEQPASEPRTDSRRPSRAQGAGIGAAAGGLLGTIVGRDTRPGGPGWAH